MTTEKLPDDFEPNIDTCNEEIARLAKRLGQTSPEFVANIYDANAKIEELNAELAKRKTTPVADVVAPIAPKINVAPRVTDTPRKMPTATGLQRAINANVEAQGGEVASLQVKTDSVTGLQRSINANIAAQKKS